MRKTRFRGGRRLESIFRACSPTSASRWRGFHGRVGDRRRDRERLVVARLGIFVREVVDQLLDAHGVLRRQPAPSFRKRRTFEYDGGIDVDGEGRQRLSSDLCPLVVVDLVVRLGVEPRSNRCGHRVAAEAAEEVGAPGGLRVHGWRRGNDGNTLAHLAYGHYERDLFCRAGTDDDLGGCLRKSRQVGRDGVVARRQAREAEFAPRIRLRRSRPDALTAHGHGDAWQHGSRLVGDDAVDAADAWLRAEANEQQRDECRPHDCRRDVFAHTSSGAGCVRQPGIEVRLAPVFRTSSFRSLAPVVRRRGKSRGFAFGSRARSGNLIETIRRDELSPARRRAGRRRRIRRLRVQGCCNAPTRLGT